MSPGMSIRSPLEMVDYKCLPQANEDKEKRIQAGTAVLVWLNGKFPLHVKKCSIQGMNRCPWYAPGGPDNQVHNGRKSGSGDIKCVYNVEGSGGKGSRKTGRFRKRRRMFRWDG
jgi:hypothetical protein